jgi:transcriptional regulator with XRE-family HTH domain
MATVKDWLNQKFTEWERAQGHKQSYYAFARYLEVSQSGLAQWMIGNGTPGGDDLLNIANRLGADVYDVLGLPRPNAEVQRVTVSFASLPPDIRQRLTNAVGEVDQVLRQERLRPDSAEARPVVLNILAKWGFQFKG